MDDSRAVLEEWDVEDEWVHPATWSDTRLREETTTQQRERWLIAAVAVGDVRFVRRLLHLGMSAHSQYEGYTLLHIALHMNDVSAVQALCEYGADPYAIGQGWTPMQIALNHTFGNINIARMLLQYSGLRYAQEMIQDLERSREGASQGERMDRMTDERINGEQCPFRTWPWIQGISSGAIRIIRVGSRTKSRDPADESASPMFGRDEGDLDCMYTGRILEELRYWHQVAERRREHLRLLRATPHYQTAESPLIWWEVDSELTSDSETTTNVPRLSYAPALRGPGNEETEMGTDQARVTAIWTLPTSEMRYGSLILSVTHPELQTIPQQGTIEYMKVWDLMGIQSIATRPDTRLMCHPMLYDRSGSISASYHG